MGTFETDKKNKLLKINQMACDNPDNLGKTLEFKYEIKGNTIIFGDKFYFERVE